MAYNVLAARRAGATDEQIARILAEETGADYQSLIDEGATVQQIINAATFEDLSFGEAFMAGARAEVLSEIDGVKQILGGELDEDLVAKENLAQQAYEERGFATTLGRLAGGLVNPSTLLPGSMLFKGAKGLATAGAVGGGVGGALRPLYEEDESRLASAALGTVGGAVIGGTLGKVIDTLTKRSDVNKVAVDAAEGKLSSAEKTLEDDLETEQIINRVIGDEDPIKSVNSELIQKIDNELTYDNLPVLPDYLASSKPRFGSTKLNWEAETDMAFYVIGKGDTKSASHEKFMKYVTESVAPRLGIAEQDIPAFSKLVRKDIIESIQKQQREAAAVGVKPSTVTVPVSKTLDSIVNPVTKGLDDTSKMVYNIGARFIPDASGKVRANLSDPSFKELETLMKTMDPNYGTQDAVLAARGYTDILSKLKETQGRNYVSKTFEQFMKDKPYNLDTWLEMAKRGDYDGCL
jgi:hypothetical protein